MHMYWLSLFLSLSLSHIKSERLGKKGQKFPQDWVGGSCKPVCCKTIMCPLASEFVKLSCPLAYEKHMLGRKKFLQPSLEEIFVSKFTVLSFWKREILL